MAELQARVNDDTSSYLQQLLDAAANLIDNSTGRNVRGTPLFAATTSTTKYYDYNALAYNPSVDPIARLYIPDAVTITAVVVGGSSTLTANTDYFQMPYAQERGNAPIEWLEFATALATYPLAIQYPWGNVGKRQIAITGTWGYCTLANRPPEIKEATLIQAVRMYERQNLKTSDIVLMVQNPWKHLDPLVEEMISPYRKVAYVG